MSTAETLAAALPGDTLVLTIGGKARSVVVESVTDRYVYTTSGHVRPGHVRGGCIRLDDGTFQATMAQAPVRIEAVERHAVHAFAAVA